MLFHFVVTTNTENIRCFKKTVTRWYRPPISMKWIYPDFITFWTTSNSVDDDFTQWKVLLIFGLAYSAKKLNNRYFMQLMFYEAEFRHTVKCEAKFYMVISLNKIIYAKIMKIKLLPNTLTILFRGVSKSSLYDSLPQYFGNVEKWTESIILTLFIRNEFLRKVVRSLF